MKATIFLLFVSTYIATASRADFDRNGEGISRNKYKNPIESGPIPIPKRQGGIHPRNRFEPGFQRFDPTSNIRMARPPKRQGNFGKHKNAMNDIRMAVPKHQGNHDRNSGDGEPGFECKLTNAKILACDLNKDGQLNSTEYRRCKDKYGDCDNFEGFLQTNFGESKRQGTNNRNQQSEIRFENPSEIKTIVLACDQDKDGQLNSKEFEECVSSMISH